MTTITKIKTTNNFHPALGKLFILNVKVMIKIMIVLLSLLVPKVDTKPYPTEFGIASWYGPGFHGRQTASGVLYDQNLMVAAHKTLPFGTVARVTNLENGLQVEVCVVDRGPYVKGRVIDLSASAATALGMKGKGTAHVRVEDLGVEDVE